MGFRANVTGLPAALVLSALGAALACSSGASSHAGHDGSLTDASATGGAGNGGSRGGTVSSGGGPASAGGASSSGGTGARSAGGSSGSGGQGAASTGGAPATDAGQRDASAGGTTLGNVYITWYGFNDNSCQVESQHDCNTIAFPKDDAWPVAHDIATEGTGAYDSPSTFATAASDDGTDSEFAPGTIIYVPEVRKYFVMEDQCFECGQEWIADRSYHVDLWMGPSVGSDDAALTACEDKLTLGEPHAGTGQIVVDPPSNLPVDTTPLFSGNVCSAHVY